MGTRRAARRAAGIYLAVLEGAEPGQTPVLARFPSGHALGPEINEDLSGAAPSSTFGRHHIQLLVAAFGARPARDYFRPGRTPLHPRLLLGPSEATCGRREELRRSARRRERAAWSMPVGALKREEPQLHGGVGRGHFAHCGR